ncbi:predicted protein [Coccidioides posadasii str. Silveira]|uniref:Predicted protein n=2 Tax=Coccidioides posadasii TaxID=199306 RepID=E9DF07_COCPS|nr:predicted protein [Coccidioides posadasii str. Silveira]
MLWRSMTWEHKEKLSAKIAYCSAELFFRKVSGAGNHFLAKQYGNWAELFQCSSFETITSTTMTIAGPSIRALSGFKRDYSSIRLTVRRQEERLMMRMISKKQRRYC